MTAGQKTALVVGGSFLAGTAAGVAFVAWVAPLPLGAMRLIPKTWRAALKAADAAKAAAAPTP